jgi:transcriptional regulator with XRE-family HTH domain
MDLYSRIRSRRESLGMSQDDLASKMGYKDRSTIAKIEAGVNDITQSKIIAFATALQTTPAYLMGWTDEPYLYEKNAGPKTEDSQSPLDKQLIELLHLVSDDQKKMLLAQIETLLKSQRGKKMD